MKKLIFTLLLLPLFAFSQGKIVSGVVNDDMGGPLPGATVQVKGSESIGSITDFDGKFTIAIRDGETRIIVSYVGFVSQEINIEGQNNICFTFVRRMKWCMRPHKTDTHKKRLCCFVICNFFKLFNSPLRM